MYLDCIQVSLEKGMRLLKNYKNKNKLVQSGLKKQHGAKMLMMSICVKFGHLYKQVTG